MANQQKQVFINLYKLIAIILKLVMHVPIVATSIASFTKNWCMVLVDASMDAIFYQMLK